MYTLVDTQKFCNLYSNQHFIEQCKWRKQSISNVKKKNKQKALYVNHSRNKSIFNKHTQTAEIQNKGSSWQGEILKNVNILKLLDILSCLTLGNTESVSLHRNRTNDFPQKTFQDEKFLETDSATDRHFHKRMLINCDTPSTIKQKESHLNSTTSGEWNSFHILLERPYICNSCFLL